MTDNILNIANQIFRLVFVVRNVAYHRSLLKQKDNFEQNYWILIFNNFLEIAVLEWCKVFGSNTDTTHWTKYIDVDDQAGFRSNLWKRLNLTEQEWKDYRQKMKDYRDKVVAHDEYNPKITNYPDFSHALESCYFYYEILIKELRLLKCYDYPDNLEEYFNRSLKQAEKISETAYDATRNIKEDEY